MFRRFYVWKERQLYSWPKPDYYLLLLNVGIVLLAAVLLSMCVIFFLLVKQSVGG